jgi:hypothetical protein
MHRMSRFRTFTFAAILLSGGVSHARAASTEAQSKANELLSSTFLVSGSEWFAAQKTGDRWELVELRHGRASSSDAPINETDRLNGVTDRFSVYVLCDQYRTRPSNWSEWTQGTPGMQQLVVGMMGGLGAYWSASFEKKGGVWSTRVGLGSHQLAQDPKLVRRLMEQPATVERIQTREVPTLAQTKVDAEAGNAEAQYAFAQSFGAGGSDWNRWMSAAAAQGYGPAVDTLAWTSKWVYFANSNPRTIEQHLKNNGAEMRRALVLASSAADKGFAHSRQLLAMAYANGVLVPQDRVESYKWYRLLKNLETHPTKNSPNDDLVKVMSLAEVQEAEARAERYQPGSTATEIRNALVVPNLKLSGMASNGSTHIAIINGTRLTPGQSTMLNVAGVPVSLKCVSVEEKFVVFTLPPDNRRFIISPGSRAQLTP